MLLQHPRSPLFPYTTLFRSYPAQLLGSINSLLGSSSVIPGPINGVQDTGPGNPLSFLNPARSEEHTSELQSLRHLVCRLLLEKKKQKKTRYSSADYRSEW